MALHAEKSTPAPAAEEQTGTLTLRRFAWGAPDELELAGAFRGLPGALAGPPALVVHGPRGSHRLAAVAVSGPPQEGEAWSATFAWSEAPAPFERAQLELGAGLLVELPSPGSQRKPSRLPVVATQAEAAEGPVERLRLQADLLAAREEVRSLRSELERAQAEAARAQEDLAQELGRQAADAERFREALAGLRASADEALTAERATADQLARELEQARRESDAARSELAPVRAAADEARDEQERLSAVVARIRDALAEAS